MLLAKDFYGRIHRSETSIAYCAGECRFRVPCAEQILANLAMHTIRADGHVGTDALPIFEVQRDAVRVLLDPLKPLVEVGTLRRHGFDELVEKVGSMYTLQAS